MSGILLSSSGGAASVNKYKVLYSKDVGKKRMVYNDGFLSVSRKTQGNQQSVTAILTDEDGKELRRLSHHNGQGLNYAVGEEVAMMQFSVQIEESLDAADASVPAVQQAPLPPLPTEKKTPFTLPTFSSSSMLKSSLPKSSVDLLSRSNKVVAPRTGFKPPSLTPSNTSSTIPSHSNETFIGVNVVESSSFKDIFVKNEELEVEHDVKICSETLKDHKENYLNHEPILQESTFKPSMSYVGIGYATLTAKNNKFICPSGSVGGVRGGPEKVNLSEITLNPSISKVMKEHQIVGANFLLDKVIRKPVIVSKVLDSLKESDDENSSDLDDGLYDTDEEEEQRRKYKRQRVHQADHNKTKEDVENQSQSVRGCILADEMGLGKTLTTLSVLYTLMQHDVCKSIIVTPSSLVDNWANETKKWLHTKMEPLVIKAGTDANAVINVFSISRTSRYPILIISYELFRKHVDLINSTVRGMDMIVCDEGHRLKNIDGTKTIEALKRCKAKMRIVLTGTPIQNDIEELYSLVSFVAPNLLGNLQHFKRLYSDHICSVESTGKDGGGNDEKAALVNLLGSIILRRTQQEVLSKLLPPRTDYIIKCKLSPTQSILYDRVVEEAKRALEGGDNVVDEIDIYQSQPESVSSCILPTLQNLRKLCVVPSADIQKHLRVKSSSSAPTSSKLLIVETLIAEIRKQYPTDKIVLVSSQIAVLDAVYDQVVCKRGWGPVHRLDGSVPVSDRQRMVDAFNRSSLIIPKPSKLKPVLPSGTSFQTTDTSDPFLFLLSTKAGGVGINLIGANRLIMLDIEWNPAADKQAMSRIWRQGQKKPVHIYRLIAADSIEESMLERQNKKSSFESLLDTDKSTQAQSDIALDKSFALGKLTPRDFHLLVYPSNSSMTALQANDVNVLKLWNEGLQCEEETLGDAPLQAMVDALGTKVLTSIEYSTCSMVSVEEANSST